MAFGKDASQAPAAPDPYKTASAQTGSNIQTAIANSYMSNPNTVGPTGSTTNRATGMQTIHGPDGQSYQVPTFTQETTLSPTEQGLYDQQAKLRGGVNQIALDQTGRIGGLLGQPMDFGGLPSVSNDFSADRSRVEQSMFDRINPQLQRDRASLETQLVNQGFQRGTEGFNSAMDQSNRQVADQRLAITGQGLQEQQGQFGMAQANRGRAMQEMLQQRNQPINEITALMSGGQVSMPNTPQYNPGQVGNTDVMGGVYNSAALGNQQYQAQLQQQNAMMGGLFGLGQAGMLGGMKYMSDRRLKHDIRDLGVHLLNGVKLYAYKYLWEARERVGVMADELMQVRPDAVSSHGGFLAVRYGAL